MKMIAPTKTLPVGFCYMDMLNNGNFVCRFSNFDIFRLGTEFFKINYKEDTGYKIPDEELAMIFDIIDK